MPSFAFASKQIFSTGQVARILRMAPRTVSKMFDCGKLKGYRIPLSGDRRITRESLVEFMRTNKFPLDTLGTEDSIVLAGLAESLVTLIQDRVVCEHRDIYVARDIFECGRMVERYRPDTLVLDFQMGSAECLRVIGQICHDNESRPASRIMAILGEDGAIKATREHGFSHVFQVPFDPLELVCALSEESRG